MTADNYSSLNEMSVLCGMGENHEMVSPYMGKQLLHILSQAFNHTHIYDKKFHIRELKIFFYSFLIPDHFI